MIVILYLEDQIPAKSWAILKQGVRTGLCSTQAEPIERCKPLRGSPPGSTADGAAEPIQRCKLPRGSQPGNTADGEDGCVPIQSSA
jgi:hypothetical protein